MERNIALKLMYNGTAYHGWQVQKNAISVAETLEKALSTVCLLYTSTPLWNWYPGYCPISPCSSF